MQYRIEINNFEGPLDLLLFFIKRDKIDVYDIPMAQITRDFIDYLKLLKSLELEIGSDFILFSSMLINIKSKMLLPKHQNDAEEIDDPRTELVSKILEYKRFKYIGCISRLTYKKEVKIYDICCIISGPEKQRTYFETIILESIKKINKKTIIILGKTEEDNVHHINNTTIIS